VFNGKIIVRSLTGAQLVTFIVSLGAMTLLFVPLWKYEMTTKNTRFQVRRLRRTLLGEDTLRPAGRSAAPVRARRA